MFFNPNIRLTEWLLLHSHIMIFCVIILLLLMQHTFSAKCPHMFCIFNFLKKKFKILVSFFPVHRIIFVTVVKNACQASLGGINEKPLLPWLIRHSFKPIIVTAVLQKMSEPSCKKYGEQIPAHNFYTSNLFHPKESL